MFIMQQRAAYKFKNCSRVNNTSCMSEKVVMKCISKTYCVALKYLKAITSTFEVVVLDSIENNNMAIKICSSQNN